MSKLMDDRRAEVKRVMKTYGIEFGPVCLMSLWSVAHNLNNTWKGGMFVNTKRLESDRTHDDRFVVKSHQLCEMFPAIKRCLDYPLELQSSYENYTEYVVWRDYNP